MPHPTTLYHCREQLYQCVVSVVFCLALTYFPLYRIGYNLRVGTHNHFTHPTGTKPKKTMAAIPPGVHQFPFGVSKTHTNHYTILILTFVYVV